MQLDASPEIEIPPPVQITDWSVVGIGATNGYEPGSHGGFLSSPRATWRLAALVINQLPTLRVAS